MARSEHFNFHLKKNVFNNIHLDGVAVVYTTFALENQTESNTLCCFRLLKYDFAHMQGQFFDIEGQ